MIFQTNELLAGLKACEKLIDKSPVPILEMVRLFTQEGRAKLWAANNLAALEYDLGPSDYQIDVCFLPGKVSAALKTLREPTVQLEVTQGLDIITSHGKLSAEACDGSEYPAIKMLVGEASPLARVNTDDLREALMLAAKSASTNDALPTAAVKINVENSCVRIYGSDTRNFVRLAVPCEGAPAEYIVSREIGPYLTTLSGAECELLSVGEYIAVQAEGWRLTLNGKTHQYPDKLIDQICVMDLPYHWEVNALEFRAALELVGAFCEAGVVSCDLQGGVLSVSASEVAGRFAGKQEVAAQGDAASLAIKFDHLLQPLKVASQYSEKVTLEFDGKLIRLRPNQDFDFAMTLVL